jgi:putative two-component system response regulator
MTYKRSRNEIERYAAEFDETRRLLKEAHLETIHVLTRTIEHRDNETGEHIKRIGHYACLLSMEMGFEMDFCDQILYASPMHDIGKVGIPDEVLLKKGPLTELEMEIMKKHTEIGYAMLKESRIEILRLAGKIAYCHHEKWDGSGYPHGLKGESIPVAARIVGIVDQYDALRCNRPYRTGLSHEEAVNIITNGDESTSPDHFDPDILLVFTKVSNEFEKVFSECASMSNISAHVIC